MENNTISDVRPEICSGCAACMNICPKDCITMQFDEEGFSVPVIDTEKCINCGQCRKVCPALYPKKDNLTDPDIFMARVDDSLLYESSSGGAFAVLSKYILDRGGYVCGAAYDESFEVIHKIAGNFDELKKLKRSKYVQCQPGMIYRKVKELLQQDKYVLFSGSPCQVAGLHNFLGQFYGRLYTVDIICHGTPAPLSWRKYLSENFDVSGLEDIEFRYKDEKGARPLRMRFVFKDGKELIQRTVKNPYYYHFSKKMGLRWSCGNCEGAVLPRVGDFSIGDFWGADVYHEELVENAKGLSLIYCNNDHSKELIPFLKKEFTLFEKVTLKEALTKNRRNKERKMPENREIFFESLKAGKSFNKAVAAASEIPGKKYDVAIYGNTLGGNYGGLATYYALYKACEKLGYSAIMIRPIKRKDGIIPEKPKLHGTRFCEENIVLSESKYLKDFKEYNNLSDTFILGSDQIWNQSLFKGRKLTFYLDFVDNSKKKIAYAASFGYNKPQMLKEQRYLRPAVYYWMNQIDNISVREADGVDICRHYFDTEATHVLDPVFLLDTEDYKKLADKAARKPEGKFITTYQLTPHSNFVSAMQLVAETLDLPRINMGPGSTEKWKKKIVNTDMPWIPDIQLEEWIYNISNAEFVVTDSFHGMCFAIMFRKRFILFLGKKGPVSRVESLLGKLGLEERWFTSYKSLCKNKDVINREIDYDTVYEKLKKEKASSLKWLKSAIEGKKFVNNPDISRSVTDMEDPIAGGDRVSVIAYTEECKKRAAADNEDMLIVSAFDHSETTVAQNIKVHNGAFVSIYNTAEEERVSSSGEFAHVSVDFHGVKVSVAAGTSEEAGGDSFREMIIRYASHKDVYRCPEHEGFIAVLSFSEDEKKHMKRDFVYVDEAGNIVRDI